MARKRDLLKNFNKIRVGNRLNLDGNLFKRSKSGHKYKPVQMPGSGVMSYTNYKMTTKSNPYLGSILPPETNLGTTQTNFHFADMIQTKYATTTTNSNGGLIKGRTPSLIKHPNVKV